MKKRSVIRRTLLVYYILALRLIFKWYYKISNILSRKQWKILFKLVLYLMVFVIITLFLTGLYSPPGLVFFLLFVGAAIVIKQIKNLQDDFYE